MLSFTGKKFEVRMVLDIIQPLLKRDITNILVVGAGSGFEALALKELTNADVLGIDIENKFDKQVMKAVDLKVQSATALQLDNGSYDLVYSYHALEHILDYQKALNEIGRVLKKDGCFFLGTPNKSRLFGYINSPVNIKEKIKWNLNDYKMRLQGKFDNYLGAHAGFTKMVLQKELKKRFNETHNITYRYFQNYSSNKYPILCPIVKSLKILHITGAFTSLYFVCFK